MSGQDTIAVIGAGVIGAAVAFALAREGRAVVLLDRAEPGVAGASFGNVGHIAAELVQPLPSVGLLCGFWRELLCFDGALDLPARQGARWLAEIGRPELLRRHGHYEIGFGNRAPARMGAQTRAMARLGIDCRPVAAAQLLPLQR